MSEFIRAFVPGGTFFLTAVTYERRSLFKEALARRLLHAAIRETTSQLRFDITAMVLLPEHFHWIIALPEGDSDYPARMSRIKSQFTRAYLAAGGREAEPSEGYRRKRVRGVWQPRYWEHTVRDETDLKRHIGYICYNPVKHGLVRCVHEWPWSTFPQAVAKGWYEREWGCSCNGAPQPEVDFEDIAESASE